MRAEKTIEMDARFKRDKVDNEYPRALKSALFSCGDHIQKLLEERISELLKAKEDAEAASRAKGTILANMSHEIRTPLCAILGFAQLLEITPGLSDEQIGYLSNINRSGEHLLELVNNTLEMARIDAGRLKTLQVSFDLRAMLSDIEAMFRRQTENKGLEFSVRYEGAPSLCVYSDRSKLRQVLINLVGNALKFTERGSIALRASARQEGDGTWLITFEVEDTGCGISKEELPGLYRPFEQTEQGAKAGVGTGLGLAISKAFVKTLGGDLTARSVVGEGSLFSFYIRASDGEASHAAPAFVSKPFKDEDLFGKNRGLTGVGFERSGETEARKSL